MVVVVGRHWFFLHRLVVPGHPLDRSLALCPLHCSSLGLPGLLACPLVAQLGFRSSKVLPVLEKSMGSFRSCKCRCTCGLVPLALRFSRCHRHICDKRFPGSGRSREGPSFYSASNPFLSGRWRTKAHNKLDMSKACLSMGLGRMGWVSFLMVLPPCLAKWCHLTLKIRSWYILQTYCVFFSIKYKGRLRRQFWPPPGRSQAPRPGFS